MSLVKTTWKHIRRSPYQAMAAVMIMLLTMFVASVFLMAAYGSSVILKNFESKPQITVFFKDEAKPQDIDSLKQKLNETGIVFSIKYISKEEALAIYKEQNKNDPLLLELVTANILPSSLEVSAKEAKDLADLNDIIKNEKLPVDEIVYQKDIVDSLIAWTNMVRTAGGVLLGFFTFTSVLIILMVISLKISQKREEIEILRLVGASDWYIRRPFILEGALYGLTGAFFAWIISYGLLLYATPFLSSFLTGIPLFPVSPILMLKLLGIEMGSGIVVGIIGSLLAVWRYLR
jgi:cell division transport system permease protein